MKQICVDSYVVQNPDRHGFPSNVMVFWRYIELSLNLTLISACRLTTRFLMILLQNVLVVSLSRSTELLNSLNSWLSIEMLGSP